MFYRPGGTLFRPTPLEGGYAVLATCPEGTRYRHREILGLEESLALANTFVGMHDLDIWLSRDWEILED